MPLRLPDGLPAIDILKRENINIEKMLAKENDKRPLRIVILNLMPFKATTETDFIRLLSNSPLLLDISFMKLKSHASKHTPAEHMDRFYHTLEELSKEKIEGMIVTGAPIEGMPFEEVDYWAELQEIFNWARENVRSTLYICWSAQAGLYHFYDIPKYPLSKKMFGIFPTIPLKPELPLFRGFDDSYVAPHSRHTEIYKEEILGKTNLEILSEGEQVGVSILASRDLREIYSFGHLEYDRDTLAKEYFRDCEAGLNPHIPENYFKNDDVNETPCLCWSSSAALFFSNWVNYAVYQETPFDWKKVEDDAASFGYL